MSRIATAGHDPCLLTARALARVLRQRKLSAFEVLESYLARIETHNPRLRAIVSLDVDGARLQAREADLAMRHGEVWGPLHGVPMTLKDGLDVAGLRTTIGTRELDRIADADGTVAARLRAAGAIIIGHTNVPPWLADYQTSNATFGRTANPWDAERTPGGSSGGAAAAVAAGLTPLEVGSDLVVSLRLPAHFCGVYALKPTEHRVPLTGFFRLPGAPRSVRIMSCLGPLARDLDDLELALSIIAGPDGLDSDVPPIPLGGRRGLKQLSEVRLAIATTLPGCVVAESIRRQVERVGAAARSAGASVAARLPDIDWGAANQLCGDLVATITRQGESPLTRYFRALDQRDQLITTWRTFFREYDALLLPPAAITAFTHRKPGEMIDVDGTPVKYEAIGQLGAFANLAGLPALVAPAAIDGGLPIGVQIVGPHWSELRLLQIARLLERAGILPGYQMPPNFAPVPAPPIGNPRIKRPSRRRAVRRA